MKYSNESEIPNHKEIKISYLNKNRRKKFHRSTDNIFQTYRGYTLHTIYNNFLVNPYLVRNKRYQNAINDNTENTHTFRYKNRYLYNNNNLNNINESNYNSRRNQYLNNNVNYSENNAELNYERNNYNEGQNNILKFPKINNNLNNYNNNLKNGKFILRKKIFNEENKNLPNYENHKFHTIDQEISSERNNYSKPEEYPKLPKTYINNNISIERTIEYNIKNEKEYNDSFYTNNNNKLYLSYDKKRKNYLNKNIDYIENNEYISPVIAKIAKHNYLMRNPYSDKNEYLGPSRLINNPILYPISTYKYDFDRYLKNHNVNKFV